MTCGTLIALASIAGCADAARPAVDPSRPAALIGAEPVPRVHLFENNSSSLIAWRRAGERNRILVHLDGHSDLDWLPDETVARIAAATPEELADLEQHPYAMGGQTLHGFAIWNFVYPAARLGIVREMIWVVPDGTLRDRAAAQQLIRDVVINKIQGFRVEDLRALRFDGRTIRGELLGLPVTICELADLPEISEPVLLDVDLDYFTTRSAVTQYVTARPWILPERVVTTLRNKRIRTDLATLCYSTIGGYTPPSGRWLGAAMQQRLRNPGSPPHDEEERREAARDAPVSDLDREVRAYRELVARRPEDPARWFGLGEALESSGRRDEADAARQRAARLDPVLRHGELFVADRLWINEGYQAALVRYERYLEQHPDGPFTAYALRRKAGCLMRLKRNAEAIETYRQVVALAPDHADSRVDLGVLYRERGELEHALEHLAAARRTVPERGVYARALGTTYLLAGDPERAVAELEFAVRSQPCLAVARGNLASALLQTGRYDEAARQLGIAMYLQPDNAQFQVAATQLNQRGIRVTPVSAP